MSGNLQSFHLIYRRRRQGTGACDLNTLSGHRAFSRLCFARATRDALRGSSQSGEKTTVAYSFTLFKIEDVTSGREDSNECRKKFGVDRLMI